MFVFSRVRILKNEYENEIRKQLTYSNAIESKKPALLNAILSNKQVVICNFE